MARHGGHGRPHRFALIGDVGGHRALFESALRELGADPATGRVPADLVVVQVGDLVHRGPDSVGCVDVADRMLRHGDGRYVQLLGNHEAFYLGGPRFRTRDDLTTAADHTVQRWWLDRSARLAIAVDTVEHGELLVTHAGLTAPLWRRLGAPSSATEAATAVNRWVGLRADLAFAPGVRLGGHVGSPGPVWADPLSEVYPSWRREESVPFGQVHGHYAITNWSNADDPLGPDAEPGADVDIKARHTTVRIGAKPFIGIDPEHGAHGATSWSPLVLTTT